MAADDGYSKLERTLVDLAVWKKKIKLEIYYNAAARTTHDDADRRAGPRKLGED